MLPIALVTGFLGTGKTTFLKNLVESEINRKIVYVVNEFSPRDVDAQLVYEKHSDVVSIPGGSIFCKCLVSEFISKMNEIAKRWHDADGVVIEASGMASPKVIAQMLSETGLDANFYLASVIAVVEPISFLKLCHTLPNIVAQIEAADFVLLNKLDLCPQEKKKDAIREIRRINPKALLVETIHSRASLELFARNSHDELKGEYAKCVDANFATFTSEGVLDSYALNDILAKFSSSIYRIKGWLSGEYIDYSLAGLKISKAFSPKSDFLVWIVKGSDAAKIKKEILSRKN